MKHRRGALLACAAAIAACGQSGRAPAPTPSPQATTMPATVGGPRHAGLRLTRVASGFDRPVWVGAPAGDRRLFVVEQHRGRILVVRAGATLPEPFLTLPEPVANGDEQGLLGLAFDPAFASNGRFVVDYTNAAGDTRIVEFTAPGAGDRADPASARTLLAIHQPYPNHNGGDVAFGPDGMLWIGMGDGGAGGDPDNRAQDPHDLLGKLLRIDVDHPAGGLPYGIPPANPYANGGGAPEVLALGLRNPWRFSFGSGGRLWIGDVGQDRYEEVDRLSWRAAAGANFGWRLFEGAHPYVEGAVPPARYVPPVATYPHEAGNCSITGGLELAGAYVYADYCSGRFWALDATRPGPPREITAELGARVEQPSSFGVGGDGAAYVASLTGSVYRLAG